MQFADQPIMQQTRKNSVSESTWFSASAFLVRESEWEMEYTVEKSKIC